MSLKDLVQLVNSCRHPVLRQMLFLFYQHHTLMLLGGKNALVIINPSISPWTNCSIALSAVGFSDVLINGISSRLGGASIPNHV